LAAQLGLFRATTNQRWVGQGFLLEEKAFEPYSAQRFNEFVVFLRLRSHIDDVAMLALLYREAVAERNFEDAGMLWREFLIALMNMALNLGLPREQRELLFILARRRIGRDDWSPLLVSKETRQNEAEQAVWVADMFKLAGHKNFEHLLKRTDLSMPILQERLRPDYETKFNWTSISPELQYLLDNFDKFEATARHDYMKDISSKIEVMYFTKKGKFRSKRIIKDFPPRPEGMKELIAGLNKKRTRGKPPKAD